MRAFLRKYWIEVIILLGLVIGAFLLVARVNVFEIVVGIIAAAWLSVRSGVIANFQELIAYFKLLSLSDLVGLLLVLGGGLFWSGGRAAVLWLQNDF